MAGARWPPGRSGSPAPVVAGMAGPAPVVAWAAGPPVLARRAARPGPPGRPSWPAGRAHCPRRHMAQRSARSNVMLWMELWSAVSTRRISLMRT